MPVSEDEVEKVIKELARKLPADTDKVSDLIVEEFMKLMKKPLTDTCNALMESGIFLARLKLAIVKQLSYSSSQKL